MKKFMTVVFTMLLAGSLAFAQAGTGSTDQKAATPTVKTSGKKATKSHKSRKGKNSKKGSSTPATTTTTPK